MLRFFWGGCRLELHFSCFALPAFFCLFAGFTGGAFFWLAAALHEAAHLAVLFLFRSPPKTVRFSALGCRMVLDPSKPLTCARSGLVSLAGPVGNLLAFGAMALAGWQGHPFAAANLALGFFHSLPIEPMDGGLALRAALSVLFGQRAAETACFILSLALLLPLAALGFFILLRTKYNFSLLAVSVYLMLYLVLKRDFFTG